MYHSLFLVVVIMDKDRLTKEIFLGCISKLKKSIIIWDFWLINRGIIDDQCIWLILQIYIYIIHKNITSLI